MFHHFCIEQFVYGHFRCGNGTNIYTLYPWIHQHCNNRSNEDQTRPITFPDVNPMELSEQGNSNFSMAAGDFLEVYTEPGMHTYIYYLTLVNNQCSLCYSCVHPGRGVFTIISYDVSFITVCLVTTHKVNLSKKRQMWKNR